MDDFNHMMETPCPDASYQSEMMSSTNETTVNNDDPTSQSADGQHETSQPVTNNNSNENLTKLDDDQSVSASTNETSDQKTDSNEQQPNDKFGHEINECKENVENAENAKNAAEITETIETTETTPTTTENTNDETKTKTEPNPTNSDDNDRTSNSSPKLLSKETKKEEEIDLNQCRICMSSSNLLDIFRIGEKTSFRICDLIMKLAPAVKISERDFLPHSVCGVCVERVEAAYELRIQCEETDTLLRSKLKRSKKTRRTPAEFVLIDCAESSSSDSNDDEKSDDEFQLSEESVESSESDSDSSYDEKKKKPTNQRGGWKRQAPIKRANPVPYQPPPPAKRMMQKTGVVYIKADDDRRTVRSVQPVKRLPEKPATNRLSFRCDVCNRTCSSAETLMQHRRTHTDEKCNICSAVFKQRTQLIQHMQRHKEDPERICQKCQRVFGTKAECQRHVHMAHPETVACKQCKRYFPNKNQLDAHKCITERKMAVAATDVVTLTKRRPDSDTSAGSGRDLNLFKSVAPPTTTYWSDSFSD